MSEELKVVKRPALRNKKSVNEKLAVIKKTNLDLRKIVSIKKKVAENAKLKVKDRRDRVKVLENKIKRLKGNILQIQKAGKLKTKKIIGLNKKILILKKGYVTATELREKIDKVYKDKVAGLKSTLLLSCSFIDINAFKFFQLKEFSSNEFFILLLLKQHKWLVLKDAKKWGISERIFKPAIDKMVRLGHAYVHTGSEIKIKTYTITSKGEAVVVGYEKKFNKLKESIKP